MKKMSGVVVAMTTPFAEDGSIDFAVLEAQTDFLIDRGITCLYPCGTTGEMHFLSCGERKKLAETVVKRSAGRADVFVQCGAVTEEETLELVAHAKVIGADGVGVVTPSFFGLTEKEMFCFFKKVSETAGEDFPVYLYNIPQCSGNDITAEVCAKLAHKCKNIVGIKYSWNNPERISEYLAVEDYSFSVLVGLERHFLPNLALGCDGVVSGCSNAFPEIFVAMYAAYQAGDWKKALELQRKIDKLVKILTAEQGNASVKAAQQMRGIGEGRMRSPLQSKDPEKLEVLKEQIKEFIP